MKRTSLVLALAFIVVVSWFGVSSQASPAESARPIAVAATSPVPAAPAAVSSDTCAPASFEIGSPAATAAGDGLGPAFEPPGWPPTSCVCGGCCENNRCWRNGSIAKCLSF
ncbi:MAG: hypothetical protein KDD11_14970 [Acidobacteria bacterium]|nr:hypothetical protein [Acidobacteriota bacterium]